MPLQHCRIGLPEHSDDGSRNASSNEWFHCPPAWTATHTHHTARENRMGHHVSSSRARAATSLRTCHLLPAPPRHLLINKAPPRLLAPRRASSQVHEANPYPSSSSSLIREVFTSTISLAGWSMSRLMAAMLFGGARVAGAAKLTGATAVKLHALPRPAYFLSPRPQPATWSRLCLQTAPKSSQVR